MPSLDKKFPKVKKRKKKIVTGPILGNHVPLRPHVIPSVVFRLDLVHPSVIYAKMSTKSLVER